MRLITRITGISLTVGKIRKEQEMKFAGPSMGAAIGSGFARGMGSVREETAKDERARDTSAMATYTKLVQSGEWEPVEAKSGVPDGGVLRVGNVGFLKKVQRAQGVSIKQARLDFDKKKFGYTQGKDAYDRLHPKTGAGKVYENIKTGDRKIVGPGELPPPGYYKETTFSVPRRVDSAAQASTKSAISGIDKKLADVRSQLRSKNMTFIKGMPQERIEGNETFEGLQKESQRLGDEEKRLTIQRARLSGELKDPSAVGGSVGSKVLEGSPVEDTGEGMIIPEETWRQVGRDTSLNPTIRKRAEEEVAAFERRKPGMLQGLVDMGKITWELILTDIINKYEARPQKITKPGFIKK